MVFNALQRRYRSNRPYPLDGEMASICCVSALNRAKGPLFDHFRALLCHFSRETALLIEYGP
jgi:hypothetical protein